MYEFIRLQYIMGKLTVQQVQDFVPRWITVAEASQILAELSLVL